MGLFITLKRIDYAAMNMLVVRDFEFFVVNYPQKSYFQATFMKHVVIIFLKIMKLFRSKKSVLLLLEMKRW